MGKFMVIYLCVSGLLLGFSWSLVLHAMTLEKAILIGSLRCIPIHPTFGAELVFVLPVFCALLTNAYPELRVQTLVNPFPTTKLKILYLLKTGKWERLLSVCLPATYTRFRFGVLVFRDTGLDDQGHIRFSYQLGDLEKRPIFREDDPGRFKHPELFEIGNVDKDGNVYTMDKW